MPSQTEIARILGVSQRTVSAVLNNNGRISPQTRLRVLDAFQELDYRPNRLASGLRGGRTHAVGAIWPVADPWAGDAAISLKLVELLHSGGLAPYSAPATQDAGLLCNQIYELSSRGVDALLLYAIPRLLRHSSVQKALKRMPAVVAVTREPVPNFPGDLIVHDRNSAIREVVAHLARTGRKRIAIMLDPHEESNPSKLSAFYEAYHQHGLPEHRHSLIPFKPTRDPQKHGPMHAEALNALFPRGLRIPLDAIFCINDIGALHIMRELQDRAIAVPGDIAVIGFNNSPAGSIWSPPLASVNRKCEQVAQLMYFRLRARLKRPDEPFETHVVPMTFVHRQSAG